MTVYRYDLAELEETQAGLSQLSGDFGEASRAREASSGAMGYGSLRDAVESFTENWKHNRDKQIEAIDGASTLLGDIVTNYTELDNSGVCSLQDE